MAITIFLVCCAAALAFLLRFLVALQKETRHSVASHPVIVHREAAGARLAESPLPVRTSVYGDAGMVPQRHNPSAA